MEKARHYRYDPYQHPTDKTATLKRNEASTGTAEDSTGRCLCFGGSRKDSSRVANDGGFAQGVFSNLGICALLVGYTLLGSFVFLAIEGGGYNVQLQRSATSYTAVSDNRRHNATNSSSWLKRVTAESRNRTVENIWDITVALNILYRDNWTRLAAQEITRFQEQIMQRLSEEMAMQATGGVVPATNPRESVTTRRHLSPYEWNFARAFLYSLTVLTTIGYGSIAPRTALGKAVTMGYAVFGIPLMLIYLSSVGSLLSRCARNVFTRTLCCCLCSNCGYCCYDEKRMQEKERRMKKKRQQLELQQQQQQQQLQEPFYLHSSSSVTAFATSASSTHNNLHSPLRDGEVLKLQQSAASNLGTDEYLDSSDSDSKNPHRNYTGSLAAPIVLCLVVMLCYICAGAVILTRLESWSFLDGSYFCFMSLSTIGFGDLLPGSASSPISSGRNATVWFCSLYILTGMALTAMCFNILHDEIVHRLKHHHHKSQAKCHQDKASLGSTYLEDSPDPYSASS